MLHHSCRGAIPKWAWAVRSVLDPDRNWRVSRMAGFRSSNCRKAAQKLEQRRVDSRRPLLLKPVAGIPRCAERSEGRRIAQFNHIDAGYHAQDRFEAAGQKGGRMREWLAVKRGKLFEIAFGVAIAIERAPDATAPKLAGEVIRHAGLLKIDEGPLPGQRHTEADATGIDSLQVRSSSGCS
jgi:hypothetical protein